MNQILMVYWCATAHTASPYYPPQPGDELLVAIRVEQGFHDCEAPAILDWYAKEYAFERERLTWKTISGAAVIDGPDRETLRQCSLERTRRLATQPTPTT